MRNAQLIRADLIYSTKGNGRHEEWFRVSAELSSDHTITADLPPGTTHYFINLIYENNVLVSDLGVPGANHFNPIDEKVAKYAVPAN